MVYEFDKENSASKPAARLTIAGGITYNTNMSADHIVLDTNVLIAALRSRHGAAYKLLWLLGSEKFTVHISVPLVLEYEDVALRMVGQSALTPEDIDAILDYICSVAVHHKVFYLWRPFLPDPSDDMVLELAVAGRCNFIVTYNQKDFIGIEQFGIQAITPQAFLKRIGASP